MAERDHHHPFFWIAYKPRDASLYLRVARILSEVGSRDIRCAPASTLRFDDWDDSVAGAVIIYSAHYRAEFSLPVERVFKLEPFEPSLRREASNILRLYSEKKIRLFVYDPTLPSVDADLRNFVAEADSTAVTSRGAVDEWVSFVRERNIAAVSDHPPPTAAGGGSVSKARVEQLQSNVLGQLLLFRAVNAAARFDLAKLMGAPLGAWPQGARVTSEGPMGEWSRGVMRMAKEPCPYWPGVEYADEEEEEEGDDDDDDQQQRRQRQQQPQDEQVHRANPSSPRRRRTGAGRGLQVVAAMRLDGESLEGCISGERLADAAGHLTRLRALSLAGNRLSGPLPASLGALATLEELNLSSNRFTGVLPEGLQSLTRLRSLLCYDNGLSGEIPPSSLARLVRLRTLDLGLNRLSGSVPWGALGRLSELRSLNLAANRLVGPIGLELETALTQLRLLNLESNDFELPRGSRLTNDEEGDLRCTRRAEIRTLTGALFQGGYR